MTPANAVKNALREWTGHIPPGEKPVVLFGHVRDIPFAVEMELYDPVTGPSETLRIRRGFCVPKHFLLGEMYGILDIPVKYCIFPFRWKYLGLDYPDKVLALSEGLPVTYHMVCRVFLEGRWALVDATWDSGLRKAGFPVNESWDGKGDTLLAVRSAEEIQRTTIRETDQLIRELNSSYSLPEKLQLSRFSAALNAWIEKIRVDAG